jgi:methyl-accepting chemotaxis protein
MNWSPVRRAALYATVIAAMAMASACLSQKDPAQKALNDATDAVNQALTPDSDKYAPSGVTALQGKLAGLKTSFDGKNYATVITAAPDVMVSARDLTQLVATNKEAEAKKLAAQWAEATAPVRNLLETVHAKVDELAKAKHPPKHVDLPTARTDLTAADDLWAKAKSSYGSGKIDEALASVQELKEKAKAAAAAINLQIPQTTAAK